MLNKITDRLALIRMRQQFARGFRWASIGLLAGALLGSAVLLLQRADLLAESNAAWLVVLTSTVIGLAIGLVWPTNWQFIARLVDETCDLKDRSRTAVDFAARKNTNPLHQLQIEDALKHLDTVDPKRVSPMRVPRLAVPAICVLTVMLAIELAPKLSPPLAQLPQALPVVLEQANMLEETMLEELELLAKENEDQELEELAQEMQSALEELKQPEVDQREALAKLSEMQQAIAEAMQRLDVEQIDAQLEQLAQALQAASATEAASQSLQAGDYDQAASELEKIETSSMNRKERKAVASNLAKLSKKLGEGKKGELSDAISEMAQGLENDNESQCNSGACKAAGVCRSQAIKKKISDCLACQLNRLAECKSCCQGAGGKPGSNVAKSDSPSNSWGTGVSGKPLGEDKTSLDSTRRQEDLTGAPGDGPSERETLSTPEARQDAARSYEERYAAYRKQVEEVLDSEPLPLGHRQTVRRYFESIRPENGQAELEPASGQ